MGRLRARLAEGPDRDILVHTEKAREELEAGLRAAHQAQKVVMAASGEASRGIGLRRLRGVEASIRRALQALDDMRRVVPRYDLNEPDLQLEPRAQKKVAAKPPKVVKTA